MSCINYGDNSLSTSCRYRFRDGTLQYNGSPSYRSDDRTRCESDGYMMREKSNRNAGFDGTHDVSRGPRAQKSTANLPVENKVLGLIVRRDQYNLQNFQTEYEKARFFVIKSFSEDDVHKSIKFNVWSSTPNGNRKLDASFRDVTGKASDKSSKCPIFLFFSVNGSGQFVGLAEMVGAVDFNKNLDIWKLDMWNGFFPVKWHIIKDIHNSEFRHIILSNNDSKPVPHSRDTQEVELKQGLEMLSIFKHYVAKSSILDDFAFYENQKKSDHDAVAKSKPAFHHDQSHCDSKAPLKQERRWCLNDATKNLFLRERFP